MEGMDFEEGLSEQIEERRRKSVNNGYSGQYYMYCSLF